MIFQSLSIVFESYQKWIARWDEETACHPSESNPLLQLALDQHKFNYLIWHEEDIARRKDVGSEKIATVKRNIDKYNQKRNDAMERVDEWLLLNSFGHLADREIPMRTETPGSVLDRLSILALKVFHMNEQTERIDADDLHITTCREKLGILKQQQKDLQDSLVVLLADLTEGRIRMKVYRQFKMYNDPNLNPQLYGNIGQSQQI